MTSDISHERQGTIKRSSDENALAIDKEIGKLPNHWKICQYQRRYVDTVSE